MTRTVIDIHSVTTTLHGLIVVTLSKLAKIRKAGSPHPNLDVLSLLQVRRWIILSVAIWVL